MNKKHAPSKQEFSKLSSEQLDDLINAFTQVHVGFQPNDADVIYAALERELTSLLTQDPNPYNPKDVVRRQTAVFGYNYNYGGKYNDLSQHVGKPFDDSVPTIRALRDHARAVYYKNENVDLVGVVQRYKDLDTGLSSHQDSDPEIDHQFPIVGYSFGITRSLSISNGPNDYKPASKDQLKKVQMSNGSQLVMKPGMQQTTLYHGLANESKKNRANMPRISITFRAIRAPNTPIPAHVKLDLRPGQTATDRGRPYVVIPPLLQETATSKRMALHAGDLLMQDHIQHLHSMYQHTKSTWRRPEPQQQQQQQQQHNDNDNDNDNVHHEMKARVSVYNDAHVPTTTTTNNNEQTSTTTAASAPKRARDVVDLVSDSDSDSDSGVTIVRETVSSKFPNHLR